MDLAGGAVQLQVLPGGCLTQDTCRELGSADQKSTNKFCEQYYRECLWLNLSSGGLSS